MELPEMPDDLPVMISFVYKGSRRVVLSPEIDDNTRIMTGFEVFKGGHATNQVRSYKIDRIPVPGRDEGAHPIMVAQWGMVMSVPLQALAEAFLAEEARRTAEAEAASKN